MNAARVLGSLVIVVLLIADAATAELFIDFCFEKCPSQSIKVVALNKSNFQVIPKGEMDNQVAWFTGRKINKGDTIVTRGVQFQEYVEFLDLVSNKARVRQYGWARGIGEFNQIKEVPLTERCKQ